MGTLCARLRFVAGAFALVLMLAFAGVASAQQPSSVNPTASAVKEEQLLRQLHQVQGRCTLPDEKACVVDPAGGTRLAPLPCRSRCAGSAPSRSSACCWRSSCSICGAGSVKIECGRSGRTIVRFNAFERLIHWMTATCFIILALSGLNITFGKKLLLPLIGPESFTAWSQFAKYAHNYLSFPFTIGVVVVFLMWIAGNIPNRVDVEWVKRGGGILGHDHPPAYRFNAGQKTIYWLSDARRHQQWRSPATC